MDHLTNQRHPSSAFTPSSTCHPPASRHLLVVHTKPPCAVKHRQQSLPWPNPVTVVILSFRVEIQSLATSEVFKVNGHRLKPFNEGFNVENVAKVDLEDLIYIDLRRKH